jgi:hypothetical protein
MISCFPDPYPDELLYSVSARYLDWLRYPYPGTALRDLFGQLSSVAGVDLTGHLDHLVASLPAGHVYSVDGLINGHTLLPFYAPFLPQRQLQGLVNEMRQSNGSNIGGHISFVYRTVPPPQWLRCCPVCIQRDEERWGERYWHRVHQIPGVMFCPEHLVALEETDVPARRRGTMDRLVALHDAVARPASFLVDSPWQKKLLQLARDAAWLLLRNWRISNVGEVHQRYQWIFAEQGLANYRGVVHSNELLKRFKSFYPPELLAVLHCEVDEDYPNNWVNRLVRTPKHAQHPLYHLLLLQMLGYTAEAFFQLPLSPPFFGTGPWPCLNPTSSHYMEPTIQEYQLCDGRFKRGHLVGRFACQCGFVYLRAGPDGSPEDRNRYDRVESYGSVWTAKLREWWGDPTLNRSQVASRLGVGLTTMKLQAIQVGLLSAMDAGISMQRYRIVKRQEQSAQPETPSEIEVHRASWLLVRKEYPEAGRSLLKSFANKTYWWLYQHDREWLMSNLPPDRRKGDRVDWPSRDRQLAREAQDVANRLKLCSEYPVQVTRQAIIREMNEVNLLTQATRYGVKLPLTMQVLAEVEESNEAFAVRRVWWAARSFYHEQCIIPQLWQLIRRASVYHARLWWPAVEEALHQALQVLGLLLAHQEIAPALFELLFPEQSMEPLSVPLIKEL